MIVTGYDGIEEAYLCSPRLSTVNCDIKDIATSAALSVMEYIDENKKDNISIIPKISINESCGCGKHTGMASNVINRLNDSIYRYQDDIRCLQDMTISMQLSADKESLISELQNRLLTGDDRLINHLCVVAEKYCFDPSGEILNIQGPLDRDSVDFVAVCNSLYPEETFVDMKEAMPVPHLKELFETKKPIVFNAMIYLKRPLGYICYFYPEYDMVDYARISNITNSIGMGLGGYVTMRRQQYLSDMISEMYKYDTLTGLYNRTGFKTAFSKIYLDEENQGKPLTTIMTDLDKLKYINDNFGHEAGDVAIKAVASALKDACPANALVMRFGGDEMLAFIPGECDSELIMQTASDTLKAFNEENDLPYTVSASYGAQLSTISKDFNLEDAVRDADMKMYVQKKSKK